MIERSFDRSSPPPFIHPSYVQIPAKKEKKRKRKERCIYCEKIVKILGIPVKKQRQQRVIRGDKLAKGERKGEDY